MAQVGHRRLSSGRTERPLSTRRGGEGRHKANRVISARQTLPATCPRRTDVHGGPPTARSQSTPLDRPLPASHRDLIQKVLPKRCFQSHLLLPGLKYISRPLLPLSSRSWKIPGRDKGRARLDGQVPFLLRCGDNGVLSTEARGQQRELRGERATLLSALWKASGCTILMEPLAPAKAGGFLQRADAEFQAHRESAQGRSAGGCQAGPVLWDPKPTLVSRK